MLLSKVLLIVLRVRVSAPCSCDIAVRGRGMVVLLWVKRFVRRPLHHKAGMIYKQQRAQISERAQQRMPRLKIEDLKENKNNVYTLRD